MDELRPFLQPSASVESDHPRILELSRELTAGVEDPPERARLLFRFVRDTISYSPYLPFHLPEHHRATVILQRGKGFCIHKAVVLASLARAVQIPARLVYVDMINHLAPPRIIEFLGTSLFVYHCYVQLHLGGQWLRANPAFDRALCQKHDFPLVEFDGRSDAIFPEWTPGGLRCVEYVRKRGTFADVPLEPMLQAWGEIYGVSRVERWKLQAK